MKFKKTLSESMPALKKIEKAVSKTYLYYASTFGFIMGWMAIAIILISIGEELPLFFVFSLRVFYFLFSFLVGLKLTLFLIHLLRKLDKGILGF